MLQLTKIGNVIESATDTQPRYVGVLQMSRRIIFFSDTQQLGIDTGDYVTKFFDLADVTIEGVSPANQTAMDTAFVELFRLVTDGTGGGGGGTDTLLPITGTGTATGDISGQLNTHTLDIVNDDGAIFHMGSQFQMGFAGVGEFIAGPGGLIFEDDRATPKGFEYDGDYSANYSNRSLVDKEYVDGLAGTTLNLVGVATDTTVSDAALTGKTVLQVHREGIVYKKITGTPGNREYDFTGTTITFLEQFNPGDEDIEILYR